MYIYPEKLRVIFVCIVRSSVSERTRGVYEFRTDW